MNLVKIFVLMGMFFGVSPLWGMQGGDEAKPIDVEQVVSKAINDKIDYYTILGIAQTAADTEIKSAYKKLAAKYHPDKQSEKSEVEKNEASAKMTEINDAYSILSDPASRKMYDQYYILISSSTSSTSGVNNQLKNEIVAKITACKGAIDYICPSKYGQKPTAVPDYDKKILAGLQLIYDQSAYSVILSDFMVGFDLDQMARDFKNKVFVSPSPYGLEMTKLLDQANKGQLDMQWSEDQVLIDNVKAAHQYLVQNAGSYDSAFSKLKSTIQNFENALNKDSSNFPKFYQLIQDAKTQAASSAPQQQPSAQSQSTTQPQSPSKYFYTADLSVRGIDAIFKTLKLQAALASHSTPGAGIGNIEQKYQDDLSQLLVQIYNKNNYIPGYYESGGITSQQVADLLTQFSGACTTLQQFLKDEVPADQPYYFSGGKVFSQQAKEQLAAAWASNNELKKNMIMMYKIATSPKTQAHSQIGVIKGNLAAFEDCAEQPGLEKFKEMIGEAKKAASEKKQQPEAQASQTQASAQASQQQAAEQHATHIKKQKESAYLDQLKQIMEKHRNSLMTEIDISRTLTLLDGNTLQVTFSPEKATQKNIENFYKKVVEALLDDNLKKQTYKINELLDQLRTNIATIVKSYRQAAVQVKNGVKDQRSNFLNQYSEMNEYFIHIDEVVYIGQIIGVIKNLDFANISKKLIWPAAATSGAKTDQSSKFIEQCLRVLLDDRFKAYNNHLADLASALGIKIDELKKNLKWLEILSEVLNKKIEAEDRQRLVKRYPALINKFSTDPFTAKLDMLADRLEALKNTLVSLKSNLAKLVTDLA